jgi:tetratricopeptide (TPR) repeat protein
MADSQRIEDLRRRVQKDPASIAFAQLAEECRRAGQHQESVDVCRAGLAIHPAYLSARVTLGRALIELNELDTALTELTTVLKSAPENLAAIRGVAEIHHRRGDLAAALAHSRAALALARNDPDLQQTVAELARQIEPLPPPASADGLSFAQMQDEFLKLAPPPSVAPRAKDTEGEPPSAATATEDTKEDAPEMVAEAAVAPAEAANAAPPEEAAQMVPDAAIPAAEHAPIDAPSAFFGDAAATGREAFASLSGVAEGEASAALQTVAVLERWLDAIHVARAERGA